MSEALSLTTRDREILETLATKVKLLTVGQVARTWWPKVAEPEAGASRRLRALEGQGLIESIRIVAHPEIDLTGPLICWAPPDPEPDLGALSYRLNIRWAKPFVVTAAVIATRKTANHFGGDGARYPKEAEQNHDVHLSTVYLRIRETNPLWAQHWISEQRIKRSRPDAYGEKLPDAKVQFGDVDRIVEFGGAYSKDKLQSFHAWCVKKSIPYEIW